MLRNIRNVIIIILTILAAYVIQSSVLPAIEIGSITPNLMLIVTASYAFLLGDRPGILVGFLCGLLTDIFFGPVIGFSSMVYAVIGYLCGKFKNLLYVEDLSFPLIMIGVSDFACGFLNYVFLFLVRNRLYVRFYIRTIILPEVIYTVLLGVVIYPLLSLLYRKALAPRRRNPMPGIMEQGGKSIPTCSRTIPSWQSCNRSMSWTRITAPIPRPQPESSARTPATGIIPSSSIRVQMMALLSI